MKKTLSTLRSMAAFSLILSAHACSQKATQTNKEMKTVEVDPALFLDNCSVQIINCTLSDGTKTRCLEITASLPKDHQMGPWCPSTITDSSDHGGIWIKDDKVYDVDGAFIKNLASFYEDDYWHMYDEEGTVKKTQTKEDCINAANPNVGAEYTNFCVECLPDHITETKRTWVLPIKPVMLTVAGQFNQGRGGHPGGPPPRGAGRPPHERPANGHSPDHGRRSEANGPSLRGIAFNGVEFSAAAPLNNILSAYTLAPFDDAGGHINVHQGYHYHSTGYQISTRFKQLDGHAAMIGYAMDGHGIYDQLKEDGHEPSDLDECRGHSDSIRGYHYHVDSPGSNNFINCLSGAYVN